MGKKVFILAGETSSDILGAYLMDACENLYKIDKWFGIGGPMMIDRGLISSKNFQILSVIGVSKIFSNIFKLYFLMNELIDQVLREKPDYIFTVDTKIFSLIFALKLQKKRKKLNFKMPIIQFVAPSAWAWGKWRISLFEKAFDGILCLYPFEPKMFNKNKINAVFVGHPFAWELKSSKNNKKNRKINLAIFPGSRISEIKFHLPLILNICIKLNELNLINKIILPTLPEFKNIISKEIKIRKIKNINLFSRKKLSPNILKNVDLMISSSGTVTLETALLAIPGIVIYHLSLIDKIFVKFFVNIKTPVLPEIILNQKVYKFFILPNSFEKILNNTIFLLKNNISEKKNMYKISKKLQTVLKTETKDFKQSLKKSIKNIHQ